MSAKPIVAGLGEMLWDVYPDDAHFGGAPANFACHASGLGVDSWMVSAVGSDTLGDRALDALARHDVRCALVARDAEHPTGQVSVTLDAEGQPQYAIAEDTAWDHLAWSVELGELAPRCDAICFGSLGQRSFGSRSTIRRFVESVPRSALRVFDVNLRQRFYDREIVDTSLRLASAIKLNDEELPIIAEMCGIVSRSPLDALKELATCYDLRLAALTRGPRGALLVAGDEVDECAAPPVAAVDTVGAGDAFTATLVAGFLRDVPLEQINRRANAVAAFVCSQSGATPSLPRELCSFD